MKFNKNMLTLYAVTDKKSMGSRSLEYAVEQALLGGATMLQLRDKYADFDTLCRDADSLLKICQKYNVPLIINDRVDVAIKCGADGVHLGQNDTEVAYARKILGKDKIIGGSARSVELAKKAELDGADYIGCGAVFGTNTKTDAKYIGTQGLQEICSEISIPVVAIGGVKAENIVNLADCKMCGVAIISGIFGTENIYNATKEIKRLVSEVIHGGKF